MNETSRVADGRWVAVMFVLPYIVATPLFMLEERIFGDSREALLGVEGTTIIVAILAGFAGLMWARRGWAGRLGFGLVYLISTLVVFGYWGLYARGYMYRFNPLSDMLRSYF
jgi:hypothetical protein